MVETEVAAATTATAAGGVCMAVPPLYWWGVRNPWIVYEGLNTLNDIFNPSMPATTPWGMAYGLYDGFLGE